MGVRLAGLKAAGCEAAVLEIPCELKETPISRDPLIFTGPRDELEARREILKEAIVTTLVAGIPREYEEENRAQKA